MYFTKNLKRWTLFSLSILVAIGVAAVLFFALPSFRSDGIDVPLDDKLFTADALDITYVQAEWVPELPVRLVIPAINVDAEIQYVGLAPNDTGEMDVPSNFTDVGWYKYGTRPGMRGSAVIAGHYNGKETPEAVFYNLHTLNVGDEIVIMSAERIEDIFHVVKVESYDYDASTAEVFVSTDGKKRLNLITCSGAWLPEMNLYNKRTVVFTELLTDVE